MRHYYFHQMSSRRNKTSAKKIISFKNKISGDKKFSDVNVFSTFPRRVNWKKEEVDSGLFASSHHVFSDKYSNYSVFTCIIDHHSLAWSISFEWSSYRKRMYLLSSKPNSNDGSRFILFYWKSRLSRNGISTNDLSVYGNVLLIDRIKTNNAFSNVTYFIWGAIIPPDFLSFAAKWSLKTWTR